MMKTVYKKKLAVMVFIMCFVFLLFSSVSLAVEENEEDYASDEVLILYENGVAGNDGIQLHDNSDEIEILSESETESVALVKLPDDMTVDEAIEEYGQEAGVIAVTPNYTLELYDNAEVYPNDEGYGRQSYLDQVNVKEAWQYMNIAPHKKVRVAVLDTGADINHPDLQNILNRDISGEVLKDGTIGPLRGDDYINGEYTGSGVGHGTHVCGILAAEANNMQGIAGVGSCVDNSAIELMAVDVFSNVRTTSLANLICGMQYAVEQGAQVINLSLGIELSRVQDDTILRSVCSRLYYDNIALICAAGNDGRYDGGEIVDIPCDYTTTLGVVSVNERNERAYFSNYGIRKDIAAPGTGMYSTLKNGSYGYKEGTSMSAPVVSAAAGMLYSLNPSITPGELKSILKSTAVTLNGGEANVGLLDCGKAVRKAIWPELDEQPEVILPFSDIGIGTWHYEPACYVYQRGIMTGMDESHFGPAESLSRAQFAVILHRMNGGGEEPYWAAFPDVREGTWYTDAVLWANHQGVVTGYDNGRFGPADYITREQMVLMMYRYAMAQGYNVSEKVNFNYFSDASRVSYFAEEAMQWAVATGIISGKDSETRIDPQGETARIECAIIIERFEEKYNMDR